MKTVTFNATREELLELIKTRVHAIRNIRGITELSDKPGPAGSSCDDCEERNQVADGLVTNHDGAWPWNEMHIWDHNDLAFILDSLLRWRKKPEAEKAPAA